MYQPIDPANIQDRCVLVKLCCHLSQCNLIFHLISQIYYGFWFQNTLEGSYRVSIFNDLELMQFCKRHDLFPNLGVILL